jgi:hypothetical protein
MQRFTRLVVIMLILLGIGVTGIMAQTEDGAFLRFVHAIPGVTAFDVYTDGQLTVNGLTYGEASNYANVPAGTHDVVVRSSGLTTVLWQQQVTVDARQPKTLIASTIDPLQFDIYDDDFKTVTVGTTRLRIVHAISGASGVDIFYGGDPIATNMGYRETVGAFDLPADAYAFSALFADGSGTIFTDAPFGLVSNTAHFLILYGTPAIPEVMLLSAPIYGETTSGSLRISHSIADTGTVDVFANDIKIAPSLDLGMSTEHLMLPVGAYNIEVRSTGDGTVLGVAEVNLSAGGASTAIAMGTPDNATIEIFADNPGEVTADMAVISIVNAIGEGSQVSIVLADGTILADALAFNSQPAISSIPPTAQTILFTPSLNGQSATFELEGQQFYGGVYYNLIAVGSTMFSPPALVVASTNVNQGIASAPGASEMIVEAPPQPVEAPAATEEAPPAAATEAPQVTEAPPAPPPVVVLDPERPTGRVLLDPGANLQLRQYPTSEALSLGLAPSGTVLVVNGREGAPVDIDGNIIPIDTNPDGSTIDFVDPATLLDPNDPRADIVPAETWLNVTYNTPDGGEITAWVNALYLDVREPDGDRQRLVLLPMIPGNWFGQAENTALTSPLPFENRITVRVINLDIGANLNLRRTPNTDGEILARLPGGTIAEFMGMGESGDWAFILFAPPEGGFITGWTSGQYLDYALNGEAITFDDLQERSLIKPYAEETVIGEISADAPSAAAPSVNPTRNAYVADVRINPGANLNLRRNPDAASEVLVPIPSGSLRVVDGRTTDGLWLYTSFEGEAGWVASTYVVITFNGNFVEVEEIPVIQTADTDSDS